MLHGYVGFGYITPENKSDYPNAKDVFYEYDMEGFSNIENRINFGTKRKPKPHVIYFDSKKHHHFMEVTC